jgi:gliding motility-associated-like protein
MVIHIGTQTSPPVTCDVIVNPNPTITVTPAAPATCAGVAVNLTGNSNGPSTTYVWSNGSSTNPTAVNPPANTTYTVTGTDANGCTGTASVLVTINPNLVVGVTPSAPTICIGGFVDLTASGGVSYTWSPITDLSCTSCSTTSASPAATTTYTVSGTDANGCTGSTTVTVITSTGPNIQITQSDDVICRGDTCKLTVNGASNVVWSPLNGLSTGTGNVVIASPMTTVTYTVSGDNNGCFGTGEVTVTVTPTPEINFSASITEGCEQLRVLFTDNTHPPINQWAWNFHDGTSANLSNYMQNPVHLFEDPGVYDVTLTGVSPVGCVGSLTIPQMIVIHKNPVADFIYNPMVTDELNQFIWFADQSANAVSWSWDFGETYYLGNNSNIPNPTHEYDGVGTYIVTLAIANEFGCVDTIRKPVVIEPLITFYVANSFTPNGDGRNDVFITQGVGIDEPTFEMRIYDRWGQQVFFTPDINQGWDGRISGQDKICPFGVYVYYITYLDVKGNIHKHKGTIDLYR